MIGLRMSTLLTSELSSLNASCRRWYSCLVHIEENGWGTHVCHISSTLSSCTCVNLADATKKTALLHIQSAFHILPEHFIYTILAWNVVYTNLYLPLTGWKGGNSVMHLEATLHLKSIFWTNSDGCLHERLATWAERETAILQSDMMHNSSP